MKKIISIAFGLFIILNVVLWFLPQSIYYDTIEEQYSWGHVTHKARFIEITETGRINLEIRSVFRFEEAVKKCSNFKFRQKITSNENAIIKKRIALSSCQYHGPASCMNGKIKESITNPVSLMAIYDIESDGYEKIDPEITLVPDPLCDLSVDKFETAPNFYAKKKRQTLLRFIKDAIISV